VRVHFELLDIKIAFRDFDDAKFAKRI